MTLRMGSLFSGYGGLDLAVQSVLGGALVWYSEIEPAACTVLAAHHPGVPNLGDITAVDWADVPPVDILTGGYPCQPFSHAGKRKGTNDERHLWPYVRDAIRVLRPRITVLENVRGHLTLGFDTVLADLAELGMSARWGVVRAADAGAPHGRARLFITAQPTQDAERCGPQAPRGQAGEIPPDGISVQAVRLGRPVGGAATNADGDGRGVRLRAGRVGGVEGAPEGEPRQRERARGVADAGGTVDWGKYGPAIARWESVLGRPAPHPTVPGAMKKERLNPLFVEWMMGLDPGHVTGHGLRPAQELKMLGNGVVPQQAALALRMLGVTS